MADAVATQTTMDSGGGGGVPADGEALREQVRARYAAAARRVRDGTGAASCCGPDEPAAAPRAGDPITTGLYGDEEAVAVPATALQASLGCGNPTALADIHPGEIVLDLGSGGGIDVLLSARRTGPTGFAYGVDMTDEMLALAEANRVKASVENVRFFKGTIEQVPLPDESVDVVISNCVINLSADKDAVLREAFRVLKRGGRFAVSDVVVRRDLPAAVRRSMEAWAGCIGGALHEREYVEKLVAAGFETPEVQITRTYSLEDALCDDSCGPATDEDGPGTLDRLSAHEREALDGALASAFVRAVKPAI